MEASFPALLTTTALINEETIGYLDRTSFDFYSALIGGCGARAAIFVCLFIGLDVTLVYLLNRSENLVC
jgi:hypothetical protein